MHVNFSKTKIDMILENREKYAEEYSEGNSTLKLCLLKLWDNEIYTIGCCIGHDELKESVSYIGINLIESNIDNVINLLNNIDKSSINFGFTSGYGNYGCSIKSSNKNDNIFFQNIINSLEKHTVENSGNGFNKIIDIIRKNSENYLTFQYVYRNNNLVKNYCVTNDDTLINEYKNKYSSKIYNEKNNLICFNLLDYKNKSIDEQE